MQSAEPALLPVMLTAGPALFVPVERWLVQWSGGGLVTSYPTCVGSSGALLLQPPNTLHQKGKLRGLLLRCGVSAEPPAVPHQPSHWQYNCNRQSDTVMFYLKKLGELL